MYKIYNSVRSDSPWKIYFNEGDELPYAPIGSTAYNVDTGVTMINNGNGWIEKIEISNSESGTEINNQDKTITENGVYSADEGFTGLGNVTVSVAVSGDGQELLDAFISRTATEITSDAESVGAYAFYYNTTLISANLQNATKINSHAFDNCTALKSVNMPNATLSGYAFQKCKQMVVADFPKATYCSEYAFSECSALKTVNLPNITGIGDKAFYKCTGLISVKFQNLTSRVNNSVFSGCTNLKIVDFNYVPSIDNYVFGSCANLIALIIRNTETVCTLSGSSNFSSTNPIPSGTGYIYVPSALIEQYKVATNWSIYAAQFRALENYTVDGTVTGELDETKI